MKQHHPSSRRLALVLALTLLLGLLMPGLGSVAHATQEDPSEEGPVVSGTYGYGDNVT